jgi:hypothetical protein
LRRGFSDAAAVAGDFGLRDLRGNQPGIECVAAERPIVEAKATTCCYAKSDKQWIADPQGVPWETFFTYGEATVYGEGSLTKLREASGCAGGCEPPIAELTPKPAAAETCCAPSCCAG